MTKDNVSISYAAQAPGERNPELQEFKEKMGLPQWKSLSNELDQLAERHGVSWAEQLREKIELHKKYIEYQTTLALMYQSIGLPQVNAIHNALDLQNKLFELEEKLRNEGVNPLESDEWMRARDLLAKEMQFIHKHKLDLAQFQAALEKKKDRYNEDAIFTVEADEVKQ
jgi:hypothetical protein